MKHAIITVLMLLLPSLAMAQDTITRPRATPQKSKEASTVSKQNSNSGKKKGSSSGGNRNRMTAAQKQRIIDNLVNNMVYVSGGTFTMGDTFWGSDVPNNEKPAHRVTLSSYYIGKYEVTQAEWKAVMGDNPSHFKGDNLPVENVSWYDCQEFIEKLNSITDKNFRLPTEAEWEFAARGGNNSRGYIYSGSNDSGSVAWDLGNGGFKSHPVGIKKPNELGLFDMSGNVWEWCQDYWSEGYFSSSQNNPTGLLYGSSRVFRGGGFDYIPGRLRLSIRRCKAPSESLYWVGLRLAM